MFAEYANRRNQAVRACAVGDDTRFHVPAYVKMQEATSNPTAHRITPENALHPHLLAGVDSFSSDLVRISNADGGIIDPTAGANFLSRRRLQRGKRMADSRTFPTASRAQQERDIADSVADFVAAVPDDVMYDLVIDDQKAAPSAPSATSGRTKTGIAFGTGTSAPRTVGVFERPVPLLPQDKSCAPAASGINDCRTLHRLAAARAASIQGARRSLYSVLLSPRNGRLLLAQVEKRFRVLYAGPHPSVCDPPYDVPMVLGAALLAAFERYIVDTRRISAMELGPTLGATAALWNARFVDSLHRKFTARERSNRESRVAPAMLFHPDGRVLVPKPAPAHELREQGQRLRVRDAIHAPLRREHPMSSLAREAELRDAVRTFGSAARYQ